MNLAVVDGIEYDFHIRKNGTKDYVAVYQSGYPHTLYLALNIDHSKKFAFIEALDCSFDTEYVSPVSDDGKYYSEAVIRAIKESEKV